MLQLLHVCLQCEDKFSKDREVCLEEGDAFLEPVCVEEEDVSCFSVDSPACAVAR